MRLEVKIVTLGLAVMLSFACNTNDIVEPEVVNASKNKILPLGASRVQGARPAHESFRYELWKDLTDGGWTFDFIGTRTDFASYPASYNGKAFDADHEGRAGWTSGEILAGLNDWLKKTGAPDIVLFSSPGGNNGLQGLPYQKNIQNINEIIDVLQAKNPNVTVIIEQMAPAKSDFMTPELKSMFAQIQEDVLTIATNQSTATSQVIAVDMFTGFNDDLLADDVHYNEEGAEFIANRYYAVLRTILED